MFAKAEFRADEEAERFRQLHPSGVGTGAQSWKYKHEDDDDSGEEYLERLTTVEEGEADKAGADSVEDSDESESKQYANRVQGPSSWRWKLLPNREYVDDRDVDCLLYTSPSPRDA